MSKTDDLKLIPVPARKSKLNLILMVLLGLMTAASGFFAWHYFERAAARTVTVSAASGETPAPEAPAEASGDDGKGEEKAGHAGTESTVLNFEPFLVNLADREAFRYLRVTIRIQITSKAAAEKISGTDVYSSEIRDTILGTLSTKISDEIITAEGKQKLKSEIAEKLNAFLPGKPVKAVFFTDFVVQL